jgi:hypothetical protein
MTQTPETPGTTPRQTSRKRQPDEPGARERILAAAEEMFAEGLA